MANYSLPWMWGCAPREARSKMQPFTGQVGFLVLLAVLGTFGIAGSNASAQSNPVPLVNQPLVPASVAPGGPGFTLTVNGTGFVPGSVVWWGGFARAATFVSSSQLTATIPSSDIAVAVTRRVTVSNPPPGGGASNLVLFPITQPTSAIALSRSVLGVGPNPSSIIVGDFNHDHKLDLAVANANCSSYPCPPGSLSILLGNDDGTFQPQVTYPTGTQPQSVITADFNGDSKRDLAVANYGDGTVSILLGNGDGTFQPQVTYATGTQPRSVIAADFNGDGKLDLAVANEYADTVSILLGNGDGTFQGHMDYPAGTSPTSLSTGDFNGDGKLDLVTANFEGGTVSLLLGNGDGTFQFPLSYGTFLNPDCVAAADLNADGKLDVIVTDLSSNTVSVLLGNGDGTFQPQQSFATGASPESVAMGDLNGDGKLDLVIPTDTDLGTVSTLLGNGDGTFQSHVDFATGLLPVSVALGDFNRDGRVDVATANLNDNTVSVLLNTPVLLSTGSLSFGSQNLGTSSNPQTISLTNVGTGTVTISSLTSSGAYAQTNNCTSLAVAGSCTVNVIFSPVTPGTLTGAVAIAYAAAGSPQSVNLTGTGVGPTASLSPTSLTYAPQLVGTASATQAMTLTNGGNANLAISSITPSGDFRLAGKSCGSTVAPGRSCNINIYFKPTATGTRTGTLTVADNAFNSPQTASLTGTGIQPAATLSSTSLTFATQLVGTTSPAQRVTLTNTGSATLSITSISTAGRDPGDFAQTNTCGPSLAVGANCTISITFTPATSHARSASVRISDNAPGGQQRILLTGTGTVVNLAPPSLNFGNQTVGTTGPAQIVTLTNAGSTTLSMYGIAITGTNAGDFAQTNTCGKGVASHQSCSISVTFKPTAKGTRTAAVSVSDNGGGSPQAVTLAGTGT